MSEVIDVDDVVMEDIQAEFAHEKEDVKPVLGSSAENAYGLPQVDGTYGTLKRFDPNKIGEVEPTKPSAVLVKSGLHEFLDIISHWNVVDQESVESFVLSYTAAQRKGVVRGVWVTLSADNISKVLKVPESGASLSTLKADPAYSVHECFPAGYKLCESESAEIPITDLRPDWRPWLELIQVYLQVQVNASSVDLGTLRAVVAIRGGVRINWATPLSRRMHKCLVQCKLAQGSAGELPCALHLFKVVEEFCPPVSRGVLVPKTDPESSSSSKPVVLDSAASRLILRSFEGWLLTQGGDEGKAETQSVADGNEDLKKQVQEYRSQVQKESERANAAELELARLQAEVSNLQRKRESDHDVFLHLERKYYLEKGLRKNLEEHKHRTAEELESLRKFYSDFACLRNPEEKEALPSVPFDARFATAGFYAQLTTHVSFSSLEELQEIVPPTSNLEDAYEWERQIFFLQTGLTYKESLSALRFEFTWKNACLRRSENVLAEIVACGDVVLEDPVEAYFLVGDYSASILKFYADVEARIACRQERHVLRTLSRRSVIGDRLLSGVLEEMSTWDKSTLLKPSSRFLEWQQRLLGLREAFSDDVWICNMLGQCKSRCTRGQVIDVHSSAYVKSYESAITRLQGKLQATSGLQLPAIDVAGELSLQKSGLHEKLDALSGTVRDIVSWVLPSRNSKEASDEHYLGKWPHLFAESSAEPFPNWEAIFWIGIDHARIDRQPLVPLRVSEELNKSRRSVVPPVSVRSHPKFCACPRQYSWSADADLDSVFYNWPIIKGDFDSPQKCVENYSRFSDLHRSHEDPVCFRASIFAAILASWYAEYHIVVDYRVGARFSTDMYIYNCIRFHSTRRIRMLELMCQT